MKIKTCHLILSRVTKMRWVLLFLSLIPITLIAQNPPFKEGEQLDYNIYFKYGFVMAKAGTAKYKISSTDFTEKDYIVSELSFKTSATFDKIYKIRDTLQSHSTSDFVPVYHKKKLNEGKTRYTEEMFFKDHSKTFSRARSIRKNDDGIKFDTILFNNSLAYDMVNIFIIARTINFSSINQGYSRSIAIFVGRDVVKVQVRYAGQEIIEKNEVEKFKTLKFEVDIIDKAFQGHKNAMEFWVSDDRNHVPVKIRAKLKIGAGEAELASFKNLKYPMDSKITIKR